MKPLQIKDYVTGPTDDSSTPDEATSGISNNISLRSFPSAYRLGQASPYETQTNEAPNYLPYRGGNPVQHGVTQVVTPAPPDQHLAYTPSIPTGVIGGQIPSPAESFHNPIPVKVVENPPDNHVPLGRTHITSLPPRNGVDGAPVVVPVVGREKQRKRLWVAADNHEEDTPGTPYCVHLSFDKDFPQTAMPLQSDGMIHGPVQHTDALWSHNTEHFDPTFYEYYLSLEMYGRMYRDKALQNGAMTFAQYDAKKPVTDYSKQASRMDFLAVVEESKWRTFHIQIEYSAQIA